MGQINIDWLIDWMIDWLKTCWMETLTIIIVWRTCKNLLWTVHLTSLKCCYTQQVNRKCYSGWYWSWIQVTFWSSEVHPLWFNFILGPILFSIVLCSLSHITVPNSRISQSKALFTVLICYDIKSLTWYPMISGTVCTLLLALEMKITTEMQRNIKLVHWLKEKAISLTLTQQNKLLCIVAPKKWVCFELTDHQNWSEL